MKNSMVCVAIAFAASFGGVAEAKVMRLTYTGTITDIQDYETRSFYDDNGDVISESSYTDTFVNAPFSAVFIYDTANNYLVGSPPGIKNDVGTT